MVETISSPGAVAVGARLIYPRHRGGVRAGVKFADLSLQHTGVGFDRKHPVPIARVMGAGADPLSAAASRVVERPALTAACLLVRREAFEAVGGFSSAYDYGIEDVDLCLKLRDAGGRLIYDGRAALWHHESATRAADRPQFTARVATEPRYVHRDVGPAHLSRRAGRCARRRLAVLDRAVPRRHHVVGERGRHGRGGVLDRTTSR